jgi:23S rRNA pseudouridine1911/1915/1917 synthase
MKTFVEQAPGIISTDPLQAGDQEDSDELLAVGKELRTVSVPMHLHGQRLDKVLSELVPEFSRNYLQHMMDAGYVRLNGV